MTGIEGKSSGAGAVGQGRSGRPGSVEPPAGDSLDPVFKALAHPVRRRILDLVKESPGCLVQEISTPFAMSRIAVLKHVNRLEQADLLISRKVGRRRQLYFNVVPIQRIHQRWTTDYSALWADRLLSAKDRLERLNREQGGSLE